MSQTAIQTVVEQLPVDGLSETERHRLLASERRRLALAILDEQSSVVDRECLAAKIAAHETNEDVPSEEAVQRIEVSLHHSHLPLMDDLGAVSYQPESETITLR